MLLAATVPFPGGRAASAGGSYQPNGTGPGPAGRPGDNR